MAKRDFPEGFDHRERGLQRGAAALVGMQKDLESLGQHELAEQAAALLRRLKPVVQRLADVNRALYPEPPKGNYLGVRAGFSTKPTA